MQCTKAHTRAHHCGSSWPDPREFGQMHSKHWCWLQRQSVPSDIPTHSPNVQVCRDRGEIQVHRTIITNTCRMHSCYTFVTMFHSSIL